MPCSATGGLRTSLVVPAHSLLGDLVVVFSVAVVVVVLLRRVGIPSIVGFIIAGVLAGPYGLKLVADTAEVHELAEIGVVLLLFGIGLDLSLLRVRRIWRPILVGGSLQMLLTVAAIAGQSRLAGYPWSASILFGFALAVSSTAIVLRGLESRGEVEAPHGRLTLGILIFQDLMVVP